MTEVELKLAVLAHAPAQLPRRLALLPWLAGCSPQRQHLHNTYYDTPEHQLLRSGVVLRVRRVGNGARAIWLQTLKTGEGRFSALSRRGEWESRLDQPEPSTQALAGTPWADIDADGTIFARLQPCFCTEFRRTRWMVQLADASQVEVALDLGQIVAGQRRAPICELELELKSGQVAGLFEIAQKVAQTLPVIPSGESKSERGYRLAGANMPAGSNRHGAMTPDVLARTALQSAFHQFTSHLIAMCGGDDPELVHQARVAWRRFRSARRLFKSILIPQFPDIQTGLQPLLDQLGALRDLDVARTETLPAMVDLYVAGNPERAGRWQRMMGQLSARAAHSRAAIQRTLEQAATGEALLHVTHWLESLAPENPTSENPALDRAWAKRRLRSLRRALREVQECADDEAHLHRARILAKRLRYGVEMLRPLLPALRAQRWHRLAVRIQTTIGDQRDAAQAALLVQGLPGQTPIAEFLRGHATAVVRTREHSPRT